jgi:hypothetical protein
MKTYLYTFALQISLQQLVMKIVSATGKEENQLTQHLLYVLSEISIQRVNTIKQAA